MMYKIDIIHPLPDGYLLFLTQISPYEYKGRIRGLWNSGFQLIRDDIVLEPKDILNDHLGNVVVLEYNKLKVYNCQFQLLDTFYVDPKFTCIKFTINPDLKQFIIKGWYRIPIHFGIKKEICLYDIPYATWSTKTTNFTIDITLRFRQY